MRVENPTRKLNHILPGLTKLLANDIVAMSPANHTKRWKHRPMLEPELKVDHTNRQN